MENLQIFTNREFGKVRTVVIDEEPYFVGRDVAEILGYKNPNEAVQDHVDNDDKFLRSKRGSKMLELFSSLKEMQKQLGRQDNWFINESGVYSLIFGSKLPTAKKFKHWVTHEILPSIRKHGAYMTDDVIEQAVANPDMLIRLATALKNERAEKAKVQQELVKGYLKNTNKIA